MSWMLRLSGRRFRSRTHGGNDLSANDQILARQSGLRRIADWQALFMLPPAIWLPIIAMSAVAVAAFFFNEWSVKHNIASAAQSSALTEMRKNTLDLRASLTDMESGQRGFLLSRDPLYLASQEKSLAQVAVLATRLQVLAGNDPALLARVTDASKSINTPSLRLP